MHVIGSFQFDFPHLTLKEMPKVKSDPIRRFPPHDFLQVGFTLQICRTNNKRVISTVKFGYPLLTFKECSRSNLSTLENYQPLLKSTI